jgi:hypothetical protein
MRPKLKYNRRLLCEALEPRAMLSGTRPLGGSLTNRLDPFNIAASVMGPVSPRATATASNPFAGVNVGIGLQAQATATANTFLAGIANNAGALNNTMIGVPDPFANPPRGLASPFQIGPASPVASAVIPTTNTLSPLVNAVSSLTNTLNAITSNTSSGLGNTFNTASNTLGVLTNTLNALVNATLFSDISSFLGSATAIVQVSPGVSTIATPIAQANSGIFTGAAPFAQANSGANTTVAIVLGSVLEAQTAVNNAIAQATGPIAPLVGQVLASSQSLVNNLTPQPFNNSGLFQASGYTGL